MNVPASVALAAELAKPPLPPDEAPPYAGLGAGDSVIVHPGDRVRHGTRVTAAPRG